jgi:hypothetical protein
MSAQTTFAPSRAKISAVARPMPLAAPVMRIVFPGVKLIGKGNFQFFVLYP